MTSVAYNNPLVVVGHGTRDGEGRLEFHALIQSLVPTCPGRIEFGFLEFEQPTIPEAIDNAIRSIPPNVTKPGVVVLPAQLLGARHVQVDIPREVEKARSRYPHIPIHLGKPLGADDKIVTLCGARCEEALLELPRINREDVALLVVGRGMSDLDNTVVPKMAQTLRGQLGFRLAIGCYAGLALPLLTEAFQMAWQQSFRTFLVLPFFLFMGKMVRTVQEETERFSKNYPECCVKVAGHMGPDPLLRDVLLERYAEAICVD